MTLFTFQAEQNVPYPKTCKELKENDASLPSGVYSIKPTESSEVLQVYCEMNASGGGWTLVRLQAVFTYFSFSYFIMTGI